MAQQQSIALITGPKPTVDLEVNTPRIPNMNVGQSNFQGPAPMARQSTPHEDGHASSYQVGALAAIGPVGDDTSDRTTDSNNTPGYEYPKCAVVYVQGKLQRMGVLYCIDTGASRIVVSTSVYRKIPLGKRPTLRAAPRFNAADGRPLATQGRDMFNVQLGSLKFQKELIVAAITDDVLLGENILHCDPEGPSEFFVE